LAPQLLVLADVSARAQDTFAPPLVVLAEAATAASYTLAPQPRIFYFTWKREMVIVRERLCVCSICVLWDFDGLGP